MFLAALLLLTTFSGAMVSGTSVDVNHVDGRDTIQWEPIDTITTTVQIDAGESFYIEFKDDSLELVVEPPVNMPA